MDDDHPHRVFIKHLYMSTTEKQLVDELHKMGATDGLYNVNLVKRGQFNENKSINGFLTFQTKEQCEKVIDLLQGASLNGLEKYPIEVDWAWPRRTNSYFSERGCNPAEHQETEDTENQQSKEEQVPDLRQPQTPPKLPPRMPTSPMMVPMVHPRPFGFMHPPMMMPPMVHHHPGMMPHPMVPPMHHGFPPTPPYWHMQPPPGPPRPTMEDFRFQETAFNAAQTKCHPKEPPWRSQPAEPADDESPGENDEDIQSYFDNMVMEKGEEMVVERAPSPDWDGYCAPGEPSEPEVKKEKKKEKDKEKEKQREKEMEKKGRSRSKKKARRSRSRSKKKERRSRSRSKKKEGKDKKVKDEDKEKHGKSDKEAKEKKTKKDD